MSRGGSYPHPVIGYGDDVSSTFEISDVKRVNTTEKIFCSFRLVMDDPEMDQLVSEGRVHLAVVWDCSATLQRDHIIPTLFAARSQLYQFHIAQDRVVGKVTCEVELIASEPIPDYRLTTQHPVYGDFSFDIEAGDVVGHAGTFVLDAHKLFDPMQPPIGSLFRIVMSESVHGAIDFQLDLSQENYVRIELSKEAFERFLALRSHPDLQVSFVALPALIATLAEVKSGSDDDLMEKTWCRTLLGLLSAAGKLDANAMEQAQTLLINPLVKGLRDHTAGEGEELD